MAEPGDASRPATGGTDWTAQAASTIERVVTGIRDKTTVPLTTVARALVYGVLVAVMGITIVVCLTVALIRVVTVWVVDGEVWAAYLAVGGIFTIGGALLLRTASSPKGKGRS